MIERVDHPDTGDFLPREVKGCLPSQLQGVEKHPVEVAGYQSHGDIEGEFGLVPLIPWTEKQDGLRLPFQGGYGDLLHIVCTRGLDSGINAPQIHIRCHDKRHPLEKSIPCGNVFGWRPVLVFQRGLGQFSSVIRHSHNLQLHRTGIVT